MTQSKHDLETMEMPELLELKDRIDGQIQQLAANELQELEERMQRLRPYVKGTPQRTTSKAAPKYRDPRTGKTWSGRGRTPIWLRDQEEKGKDREDFRIK